VVDGARAEAKGDAARKDHAGHPCSARIGRDDHRDADRGSGVEAKLVKDAS
jgi:hypothetical protein